MRFLQVHLSLLRGGAHVAVDNLRIGLERIGHRCGVVTESPEAAISRGSHDLVLLHSFSEQNRETYLRCLRMLEATCVPHAVVLHDYWPICHQTNLLRPSMGWKRCRVSPDDPCRPGVKCRHPARYPLLADQVGSRDVVTFTDRGSDIFRTAGFRKVHVIPHGIDASAFRFQPRASGTDRIRVCFANAWGKRDIKGYRHWDWIRRECGGSAIDFDEAIGGLEHDSMPTFLSSCDAMMFLSLWEETFGLVVVEAMACGTPVISYPTGVSPDIITDRNGFLLTAASPTMARDAVSSLLASTVEEREGMRRAARESVEAYYTLERMADDYVDLARRIGGARG